MTLCIWCWYLPESKSWMSRGAISAQYARCHSPSLCSLSTHFSPTSVSVSHWRRARSRLTWLTSLNLSAWPPRLRLRLLQASDRGPEPETEGGDRSHLIEQLVALHTTCQLCPYKFFVMPWLYLPFPFQKPKATYNIYLCHLAKRFSDLIDQIMIFTRKTSNFLCFDKIGPDKLWTIVFLFFFPTYNYRYKLLEYIQYTCPEKRGRKIPRMYIEYGCENVWRIFTFVSRTIPNTDSQSWASHPGSRPLGEEREGCGLEIGGHTEQCRNYGLS